MDKRRVFLAAMLAAAVLGAGCARPGPPAPVSAPQATESKPAPVFLQQILDTGWKLSALTGLPPRERPAEQKEQWELIYEGGALRLYRDGPDSLYALVVDHTQPAYQGFQSLTSGGNFVAAHRGKYTSVLRIAPVSESTMTELASREWTQEELTARFGEPTSKVHNHGIGTWSVTYVPQGLVFEEEEERLTLVQIPPEQIWRERAESLVYAPNHIDEILAEGKDSPDGRFRAAYLEGGGYWSQFIVVREIGRSETSYHAQYFIADYFWLDNRRLVYGEVQMGRPYRFHVIDVVAEKELDWVEVEDEVTEFGPAGENQIWYTGEDGSRQYVTVPGSP